MRSVKKRPKPSSSGNASGVHGRPVGTADEDIGILSSGSRNAPHDTASARHGTQRSSWGLLYEALLHFLVQIAWSRTRDLIGACLGLRSFRGRRQLNGK